MHKSSIIIFTLLICLSLGNILSGQDYHITIPDMKTASQAAKVSIPVLIDEDLTGHGIVSYTAKVSWDSLVLQNPAIDLTGTLTEIWGSEGFFQNDSTPGQWTFGHFVATPPLTGAGVLAKLVFDLVGNPGDSTEIQLHYFTLNGIECNLMNGMLYLNHPPVADSLTLEPELPRTTESLSANFIYSDFEGDAEDSTELKWYRNRVWLPENDDFSVLPDSLTSKNEEWYFTVKPHDGLEFGAFQISPVTTIQNSPPSVDSLAIYPAQPWEFDSLSVFYTFEDVDHDSENGSEITWFKNGEEQPGLKNQRTIPDSATSAGEVWSFSILPKDGTEFGELKQSNSIVISTSAILADFTADTTGGIDSVVVQFTDLSQGPVTGWLWDFGDGQTSTLQHPLHTFSLLKKYYTISLTIQGPGEQVSLSKEAYITVYQTVVAQMEAFPILGTDSLYVQFKNRTAGDAANFDWDFGDGSVKYNQPDLNPFVHFFEGTGNYSVTLHATGQGGVDSLFFENLIYLDEFATDLVLVDSGSAKSKHGWNRAIDHDVFTAEGLVITDYEHAWAIFTFADSSERMLTKFRLKPAYYHQENFRSPNPAAFEIHSSRLGANPEDFSLLIQNTFQNDDWVIFDSPDSVSARYILLKLINPDGLNSDSCQLAEFQVFGKKTNITEVQPAQKVEEKTLPTRFELAANYPNPFNPATIIGYHLPKSALVAVVIFNHLGQNVRILVQTHQTAGHHSVTWNGRDTAGNLLTSGIYFYKLQVDGQVIANRKMILLK